MASTMLDFPLPFFSQQKGMTPVKNNFLAGREPLESFDRNALNTKSACH